jgi:hypothetical protein
MVVQYNLHLVDNCEVDLHMAFNEPIDLKAIV